MFAVSYYILGRNYSARDDVHLNQIPDEVVEAADPLVDAEDLPHLATIDTDN